MPFSMTLNEGMQTLKLEGRVTIRNARDLSALLSDSLQENLPVAVETHQLTDVDTCVLQFLCSLRKTATDMTFVNPSGVLLEALDRTQLRRALLGGRENL